MFYPSTEPTDKLILFFHANAEDAGLCDDFVHSMKEQLRMHILAVEYPSYGVYNGKNIVPDEEKMSLDSVLVFDYLVNSLKINENNIIVMGRSMGYFFPIQ